MTILINSKTLDGVSDTFQIRNQITVVAMGLEDTDAVSFSLVLLTDPAKPECPCPPFTPRMPQVADEVPLTCCTGPVVLSRERPFAVLDAPQNVRLRAHLHTADDSPPTTQVVYYEETNTTNVNDRLRGCPCDEDA